MNIKNSVLKYCLFVLLICIKSYASSDMITIHNKITSAEASEITGEVSDGTLYARIYYLKYVDDYLMSSDELGVLQQIYEIPAESTRAIPRPMRWRYQNFPYPKHYDRQLVFSFFKEDLKEQLSFKEYKDLGAVNVGTVRGNDFYIVEQNAILEGYSFLEWQVVKPLLTMKTAAGDIVKSLVKRTFSLPSAHRLEEAYVREGNELSEGELAFLTKRKLVVRNGLETLLQREIPGTATIPTIACVFSGGGYRSMLGTTGSLVSLSDTRLLDVVTYLVGLSGSTWALGGFFSRELTAPLFREKLVSLIQGGLADINGAEAGLIGRALLIKYAYDQSLTVVDLFGALLATQLLGDFGDQRHFVYLSQQVNAIENGLMPYPLYSAVRKGVGVIPSWWEFSPYEIGSAAFGMYIPSWAYGRKFSGGRSLDFAPEQSFGQELGTFGSAFAAEFKRMFYQIAGHDKNIEDLDDMIIDSMEEPYRTVMKKVLAFVDEEVRKNALKQFGEKRIKYSWAAINNFMYGMASSPLKNEKQIRLVDGGLDFNVPYPLVSGEYGHRSADIMIFFDNSGNIMKSSELKKCEEYARAYNLKFPVIDYTSVATQAVSVFKDEKDSSVPVVIYMPLIKDQLLWDQYKDNPAYASFIAHFDSFDPVMCERKDFCSTYNFKYSVEQSLRLMYQTEFNVKASQDVIKNVISDWIDEHNQE